MSIVGEPAFDPLTLMARALARCTGIAGTDTQALLGVAESDLSDDLVACIDRYVASVAIPVPSTAPVATAVVAPQPSAPTTPRPASTLAPVEDIVTEPEFDAVTLTARAVANCTGIDVTDTSALLAAATSDLTDELVQCMNEYLAKETRQ